ncbi:biotin transporter BioY [Pseudobdellovibrio exovorus]|uniref:Biotin transporter n=1 Tax=Pseudobdellovibrio exovorus JSS TaxID=1184267 RepID=M4VQ41_9BACT|nr:biotin transporter BioY [Pseudobdellovibrio exovorus]AGH95264.1 hypothetical protein A11Q_1048 [Pseudobdellovibrio exovorus JSS]
MQVATQELSLIPNFIIQRGNTLRDNALCLLGGVALLSLLAQITFFLPWTPVPITGQTFGVALMALLWGRKRAVLVVLGYIGLGGLGLPVFALGKSGLLMGPTMGYLFGMVVAAYGMGALADKGWTRKWWTSYLAAFIGSVITFTFGLLVLSIFLPKESLLMAGLFPFLPGDLVKTLLASSIAYKVQKNKSGRK